MDLSIIIVSWNVKDLLKKCLTSVFERAQGINFEVFVIDNDSRDGSARMIQKEFPQVKLIQNKKNTGFAYANNQAIKQAQGKYILLLNPDTEIIGNTFGKTVQLMNKNDWAVLGCKILNSDKTVQESVRRFPALVDQILIQLKLHHWPVFAKLLNKYLAKDFNYQQESEVDQVMGAFFLIKRSVLEKIGDFDQKFYLWFEEVDFCKRVKDAGLKVVYTPQAQIIHYGAASFKQLNWHKQLIWNHSVQRYFWKYKPKWQWLILWLLQPISLLLALVINFFK